MSHVPLTDKPRLEPSKIGKFIQFDSCQRQLLFEITEGNKAIQTLGYTADEFPESFGIGGGIVERSAGVHFENTITDHIREQVADFYDMEQTTLQMVAEAHPKRTAHVLPFDGENELETEDICAGFEYYGVDSTDVMLNDIQTLTQHPNSTISADTNADTIETIETAFFELQQAYTEMLIDDVVNNIHNIPTNEEIEFSTPHSTVYESPTKADERGGPVVIFQPTLAGKLKSWQFSGHADILLLWPTQNKEHPCQIRVLDIKLGMDQQTHHQIQTVIYAMLLEQLQPVQNDNIPVEAGVITQESSVRPLTPSAIPKFTQDSRRADVINLVKQNGLLETVYNKTIDSVPYQLDEKCTSCKYNGTCYAQTIESNGLELLGIDSGTVETLQNNGIQSIDDLATLAKPVDEFTNPKNDTRPDKNPSTIEKYNTLLSVPTIGKQLPELIQRAQGYLQKINPSHQQVTVTSNPAHITNTGYGSLPTTKGVNTQSGSTVVEQSLIKVYINVQHDHIRDHIAGISFHVTASTMSESIDWSTVITTVSHNPIEAHVKEFELLESFSANLMSAIAEIEAEIEFSDTTQQNPFIHFYTYTQSEAELIERKIALYTSGTPSQQIHTRTYPNHEMGGESQITDEMIPQFTQSKELSQLRALIGMRLGTDQQILTAVRDDIERRIALQTPTTGLINIYEQFYPDTQADVFKQTDWKITDPQTNEQINLQDVFNHKFFSNGAYYTREDDGTISINLANTDISNSQVDGWYPYRVRSGAKIPLAYIWAAANELDNTYMQILSDNTLATQLDSFKQYRIPDETEQQHQIKPVHIECLLTKLNKCLRHVEEGIPHKSRIYYNPQRAN